MSDLSPVTPDELSSALADYLTRTRWFGGKGRPFKVAAVRTVGVVPNRTDAGPPVVIHLVDLAYGDDEGGSETYQVPLAFYQHAEPRLEHAFVGWWEDERSGWVHAYDALHDRDAMGAWLRSFEAAAAGPVTDESGLRFHRLPGHDLDPDAQSTLFAGEQSNSSVAFGDDALLKVFRKLTPGVNPDVSVHEVLTKAGSEHVAALYGWVDVPGPDGQIAQLAMLQEFLRTATDGWDLALASVRTLLVEPELHASESGGDFAGEASRLGEALRAVHDALRQHFPHETRPASAAAELAATMRRRLDIAAGAVPELDAHAKSLGALFDELSGLDGIEVQQVHGDLHLGQTLRTASGWKIVDFEGEPAKPLAERQLPDSPWRDVAGMLRSFDYAPRVVLQAMTDGERADIGHDGTLETGAAEWAERNKNHFLHAYAEGALTDDQQILLDAYIADKAVYETVYETRNRPTWVQIPLQALEQIAQIARIGAA